MNEQIRELAKQTDIWCDQNHYGSEYYDLRWEEKFAELIVRECANICDAYGMPDGTSQTAMILSAAIKKKFGVE